MSTKTLNDEYYVHTIAIAYHAVFNQYCIYVHIDQRFCLIIELTYILHSITCIHKVDYYTIVLSVIVYVYNVNLLLFTDYVIVIG